jgi:hypothetical protein
VSVCAWAGAATTTVDTSAATKRDMPGITRPGRGRFTGYAVVIEERYHSTVCFSPFSNDTMGA